MITTKQRAYLRGLANKENAIFQIGKGGLNDEIIKELEDIPCKNRGTSCPDQLAKALKIYKEFVLDK